MKQNLLIYSIISCLIIASSNFSVSLKPIPTQHSQLSTIFTIQHDQAPGTINFKEHAPLQIVQLYPNGSIQIYPKKEGSYQYKVRCSSKLNPSIYVDRQYVIFVEPFSIQNGLEELSLNNSNQSLWLFESKNYYEKTQPKQLYLESSYEKIIFQISFGKVKQVHMLWTNQYFVINLDIIHLRNIQRKTSQIRFYYQSLPRGLSGNPLVGELTGQISTAGTYLIKIQVSDKYGYIGQHYVMVSVLEKRQSHLTLFDKNSPLFKYSSLATLKEMSPMFLDNQIQTLLKTQEKLLAERTSLISHYRQISSQADNFKIVEKQLKTTKESIVKNITQNQQNLTLIKKDLATQQKYISQLQENINEIKKNFTLKQKENKNVLMLSQKQNEQRLKISKDLQNIKNDINALQDYIYESNKSIAKIKQDISRNKVSIMKLEKEQIRTRQILEIRNNIQFQYMIKKAQIDNRVRRNEDYVFLAQANYDIAESSYLSVLGEKQHLIAKSQYLAMQISRVLDQYDRIRSILTKLAIQYQFALGQFKAAQSAKQSQSRLLSLVQEQITRQSKQEPNLIIKSEYPFTGCQAIGGFSWAGTGQIKLVYDNTLVMHSGQQINFGSCTDRKLIAELKQGSWIKFNGYYWDAAIQCSRIQSLNI